MTIAIRFNPPSTLRMSWVSALRARVRGMLLVAWTELESAGARRAARYLEVFAAARAQSDPDLARQLRDVVPAVTTR